MTLIHRCRPHVHYLLQPRKVPAGPSPLLPPPTHPNTLSHLSSSQHYSLSAEDFSGSQAIRDFSWYWSFGKHWVSNANVLLDWFTYCNKSADCISKQEAGVPSKLGTRGGPYNFRSGALGLRGGQELVGFERKRGVRFQNRLSRSFIVSNAPKLLSPLFLASAPAGWTLWEIMKRTKECAMWCVLTHL